MAEAAAAAPSGRHQRSIKNYLLDRHFQLKYAGYLVGIAATLSLSLGGILWRSSQQVIEQSREMQAKSEQIVTLGGEVVKESRKVSEVVKMNIVKDPEYADDPELLSAFTADSKAQDERLKQQQEQIEAQNAIVRAQPAALEAQRTAMFVALVAVLGALVVALGVAGILVTHKVAGPIYKMKRQLAAVGAGRLQVPSPLRKGDELVEFFDTFRTMVISLRERQEVEIGKLEQAIAALEGKAEPAAMEPLLALRKDMKAALD